ncbi:MAG: ABC transporter permease subunit [Propionibacteriaceae bacterium]|jgi:putative spermidine/putrescine transport system permease protein|nr:ABC transporter permease subunit [Propionibacteriaceae bacterium]
MRHSASFLPSRKTRIIIGTLVGLFFAIPFVATTEYTFRDVDGHSTIHWANVFDPAKQAAYRPIWTGLGNSLLLMVVTVAIVLFVLAPTMILVNLRFSKLRRIFEFFALLPISIPAVVLVVGLAPIYLVVGRSMGTGAWTLAFAYGILVMPYAFRPIQAAIDSINMSTLSEAARSLGASWPKTVLRVLAPNLRQGLLYASLISVAVVLGEFTIASLLNRQNLQTALLVVSRQDPYVSVIFSLLALLLCFLLLVVIGRAGNVGSHKKGRRK